MDPKQCFFSINVVELIAVEISKAKRNARKAILAIFVWHSRVWPGSGSGTGPDHVAMFHAHAFFKAADAQNAEVVNPSLDSYAL